MNIAILGVGTVGSAVVKNILKYHKNIQIKALYTHYPTSEKSKDIYEHYPELFKSTIIEILGDPTIDVVVECMGGIDIPKDILIKSMQAGKSVVTANKDLVAIHGKELFQIAKVNNVELKYEAAVCGAIPIINALEHGLVGERIKSISGILNGTCNYILSKMTNNPGLDYKQVLAEATALGYAEADPTSDVDGWDSAYKVILLAKIAFGEDIDIENMQVKGISHLTQVHLAQAAKMGKKIKLLGVVEKKNGIIKAFVRPEFVDADSFLGRTDGVLNAVEVVGENSTNHFAGPGAGGNATAVSIISDILNLR